MAWDDERFERFVTATVAMSRGQLPGYGFAHVIFPYLPEEEMTCIRKLRALPGLLSAGGVRSALLPVAPEMAGAASRWARWDLPRALDYERIEADLSNARDGLMAKVADRLAARIRPLPDDAVIVLGRAGTLYPFGHVSGLLQTLAKVGIRHTIAVAYPGTAQGTELRLLGKAYTTGGYWGHVVT